MKQRLCGFLGAALMLAGLTGPGRALGQEDALPSAHSDAKVQAQRADLDRRLAAQETRCYQQFAVSNCLRTARRQAREERQAWTKIDSAAKEATRRSRAAQHEQNLQDRWRQGDEAAPRPASDQAQTPRAARSGRTAAPAASPAKVRQVQAERARTQARRADDAAAARQRLLDKQSAAALRQQAQRKRQAELRGKGNTQATPLADPP